MQALRPGGIRIPRALRDHRTREAHLYRAYVLGIRARLPALPPDADTTLREAGLLAVELASMGLDLEEARFRAKAKRRGAQRLVSRLRRQAASARTQLVALERRLEELASRRRGSTLREIASRPRSGGAA